MSQGRERHRARKALVIVQVALAGFGAFYAAKKVGDGPNDTTPSLTNKQFGHGFGPHDALGYLIFLASILLLIFALASRFDRKRVLLALAMPLLMRAQDVVILTVPGPALPGPSDEQVAKSLRRHCSAGL